MSAALILVVTRDGRSTVHPLPGGRSVAVGRDTGCEIAIPDLSVSRRHAVLHIGDEVEIEDLGSQNRTRVRGEALKRGARVPLRIGDIVELGRVVATLQDAQPTPRALGEALGSRPTLPMEADEVLVRDERMRDLYRLVDQVAPSAISVLLLGETGTGKDVLATELHRRSPRADRPFLRLNCATLTENLLESELFGHEKGSFTGAQQTKPGLLEVAADGTMFLDEIGEMPQALQAKLLHALETREVRRVGGTTSKPIACRFVAATNRALDKESAAGRFRADLYYRLSGIMLSLPPLRERGAEIEPLARRFVVEACRREMRAPLDISPDALAKLATYAWPGNIRELKNVMERAVALARGPIIGVEHLAGFGAAGTPAADERTGPLRDAVDSVEREHVLEVLRACAGNQSEAARRLGIARNTLAARLKRWGIDLKSL